MGPIGNFYDDCEHDIFFSGREPSLLELRLMNMERFRNELEEEARRAIRLNEWYRVLDRSRPVARTWTDL